jgi:hypothetical protein
MASISGMQRVRQEQRCAGGHGPTSSCPSRNVSPMAHTARAPTCAPIGDTTELPSASSTTGSRTQAMARTTPATGCLRRSSIGNLSPVEFETRHTNAAIAA